MSLDRTWYNTIVNDDGSNTVGTPWRKEEVDALMDVIDARFAKAGTLGYSALDFGAIADNSNDDTAAINACYAACKADRVAMLLPPNPLYTAGQYRITSSLTWDGPVSVHGVGSSSGGAGPPKGGSRILKVGNFPGIQIVAGGENVEYSDFILDSDTAVHLGIRINLVDGGAGASFRNIGVLRHGGVGFEVLSAANCKFDNLYATLNGAEGMLLAPTGTKYVNANTFGQLDLRANGSHGLNIAGGGGGTYGNHFLGVCVQNNTGYGIRINAGTNFLTVYSESNTAGNILLDTACLAQVITLLNSTGANPGVIDNAAARGVLIDPSTARYWMPSLTAPVPGTNIAGFDLDIFGGYAGVGGTGRGGGKVTVRGGDAKGTTGNADGGAAEINGGVPVNSGVYGAVKIQAAGTGALSFHGVTPVARQLLATGGGATVDQVITALQTLGLLRQT